VSAFKWGSTELPTLPEDGWLEGEEEYVHEDADVIHNKDSTGAETTLYPLPIVRDADLVRCLEVGARTIFDALRTDGRAHTERTVTRRDGTTYTGQVKRIRPTGYLEIDGTLKWIAYEVEFIKTG